MTFSDSTIWGEFYDCLLSCLQSPDDVIVKAGIEALAASQDKRAITPLRELAMRAHKQELKARIRKLRSPRVNAQLEEEV